MKLAKWRNQEGMTKADLAGELGCSQSYVSQIERARDPIIPGPGIMCVIYVLTSGQVQPNDFYDLPQCGTTSDDDEQASACPSVPDVGAGVDVEGAEGREGMRSPAKAA